MKPNLSLIISLLIMGLPTLVMAQVTEPVHHSCTNQQCYSDAGNLAAVFGLVALDFAPFILVSPNSHNYLTKGIGEAIFGGVLGKTKLAAIHIDLTEIPKFDFGIKTDLVLSTLNTDYPTNLRYNLIFDYPFFKNENTRLAAGTGLAVEKFMEADPLYAGVPLELGLQQHLTAKWKLKFRADAFLLKQPVYRTDLRFIWLAGKRDFLWSSCFGYQVEDNKIQNSTSQYLYFGFTL